MLSTDSRLDVDEEADRRKAVHLLFIGSASMALGFIFVAGAGYFEIFMSPKRDYAGEPYESGWPPLPLHVSEMVSDSLSVPGRCFFCFCLLASIVLLMAWYPMRLANVHIPAGIVGKVDWNVVRQYVPTIGMIMVATIPIPSKVDRSERLADELTQLLHGVGAGMLFGGYMAAELFALYYYYKCGLPKMEKAEFKIRSVLLVTQTLFAGTMLLSMASFFMLPDSVLCCRDVYKVYNFTEVEALSEQAVGQRFTKYTLKLEAATESFRTGKPVMVDTASGAAVYVKLVAYWAEVVAGFCMIFSQIVIGCYSPVKRISELDYAPMRNLALEEDEEEDEEEDS